MTGRRFTSATFAVNRWNIGCQGASTDLMTSKLERDRNASKTRSSGFRDTKNRARLRVKLLEANPHCDNCGMHLQGDDREAPFYASIVEGRLSCTACVRVVRALAYVESEVTPC